MRKLLCTINFVEGLMAFILPFGLKSLYVYVYSIISKLRKLSCNSSGVSYQRGYARLDEQKETQCDIDNTISSLVGVRIDV